MQDIEVFKARVREAIKLAKGNGYTQAKIGEEAGVSPQAVGQWPRTGKVSTTNLAVLARLSGKPLGWFYETASSTPIGNDRVPANESSESSNVAPAPSLQGMCPEISWVQAGQWAEVCHVDLDPESVNWYPRPPGSSAETFVLRVVGESMIPEYMPGTLIYVDPEKNAETGKDVIAVLTDTGEATFKRFIEEPGAGKMLKALNPAWTNPYLPINGNCRVIGVVVADMRIR